MPYTKEGMVPDMIVNPHAFPSRMTIGQFLESLGGKIGLGLGFLFDGTSFEEQSIEELGEVLQGKCGYHKHGTELLYSGRTGKQLSSEIFIGPTFYQRLKQMVQDKINSRAPGKINYLTKQPPAGRAAEGGLRIGEMERDAIIAHGISHFLKESTI
jgi:DNA-directed RNA polymerase beta subunit